VPKLNSGAIIAINIKPSLWKKSFDRGHSREGTLIWRALQVQINIVKRQLYSRLAVPRPLGSEIHPWTYPLREVLFIVTWKLRWNDLQKQSVNLTHTSASLGMRTTLPERRVMCWNSVEEEASMQAEEQALL
jgi:hypothetical protein